MKGMKKIVALLLALGLVVALAACGGGKKEPEVTKQTSVSGAANEPAWITRGAGAFKEDTGGLAFYGVGIAQGIANRALEMQTADTRARTDLARALDTYVANFMKDYMASAVASDMSSSEEEQFVSSITKSITETTLVGSQIINHWRGPDGTLYSLAMLSFDDVANGMKREMKKRSAEIKMNADDAMKELDVQLQKRRESGN
ncbi:MAG: hypothetical protein A2V67_19210 [Deltaproteobacteria bacterium RBG_13_61_14]|nr:MAG: hypothetical protein A2V67_19210 [Deltaproteobacteria bacterium RBG_13_61_14]